MKRIFFFLLLVSSFSVFSQGINIVAEVKGLNYDTIWFGNTFGKKSLPNFHTLKQADGKFYLTSTENITPGIYTIIFKRNIEAKYSQIPIIITEKERNFSFVCDEKDVYGTVIFNGSVESGLYYIYRLAYASLNDLYGNAVDNWRLDNTDDNAINMLEAEETMIEYQQNFIKENNNTVLASIISKNNIKLPSFEGTAADKIQNRNQFFENQFLKQYDITDEDFWKTPISIDLLDYYTFKSYDANPSDALSRTKAMMTKLSEYEKGYQYYFNYMCNSFSKMSKHDFDQTFLYLYNDYIKANKTNWLSADEVIKYKKDAENIERLMVGKTAPDVQLFNRDNTPVQLSDINAKMNLLIFWSPDCSHCKKEMPIVKKLFAEYQSKGLAVTAVCAKKTEQLPSCFEFEDKTQFPTEWYVLNDGSFKSKFHILYDCSSFPRIYILDENEKILFRRRGEVTEAEFRSVFDKILKTHN